MEVTSFSKSGEHEIRNRKEENNMDENSKLELDTEAVYEHSSLILSGKLTGKNLLGDKPIYRMADERKMMRSMPGIWRS